MSSGSGSVLMPEQLRVEGGRAFGSRPKTAVDWCKDLCVEVGGNEALIDVLNIVGASEGGLLMVAVKAVHLFGQ